MAAERATTFSKWVYSHYFEFRKEKDSNIIVKCKLCVGKPRELSTAKNSTSNLKKHLDRVHPNTKLTEGQGNRQKRKAEDDVASSPAKQKKLDFSVSELLGARDVRRLVTEYVVEDMKPLSTVESPAFVNLISQIPVKTKVS